MFVLKYVSFRLSSVKSNSLWPRGLQYARPLCPITNSQSLLKTHVHWVSDSIQPSPTLASRFFTTGATWEAPHPTISSSIVPFSSHVQCFPASGSFLMSQFFTSSGQSIGVWTSTSVLPMNIQDWFPLEWTGWISLLSKGLSRVFSNTTVQKHQFFSTQFSL